MDHASGCIQVWNQVTFSAAETVQVKLLYERDAANYGVLIQAYHNDNGVFISKDIWIYKFKRTITSALVDLVLLVRRASPNLDSKRSSK